MQILRDSAICIHGRSQPEQHGALPSAFSRCFINFPHVVTHGEDGSQGQRISLRSLTVPSVASNAAMMTVRSTVGKTKYPILGWGKCPKQDRQVKAIGYLSGDIR